jgi:hypothetical protein
MQISRRTKISLSQLLGVIDKPIISIILDKYGLDESSVSTVVNIRDEITSSPMNELTDLVLEIISTGKTLRNSATPRYKYDEQFEEFRKSLLLDGYKIEDKSISALDPNYEGKEPVEDALLIELKNSGLDNDEKIEKCIISSASDFLKSPADFNGSLTNIRVALETTIRKIAVIRGYSSSNPSGNTWGPSLAHLKNSGFFTEKEEKALAAIFTFISDGAHIPLGFSEEEFIRLGRNICSSMCYFSVKKYNA